MNPNCSISDRHHNAKFLPLIGKIFARNPLKINVQGPILFMLILFVSRGNIEAADRYSVASGLWNSTNTWSATSGGTPGASVPAAGDNVYIESGFTVTRNVTTDAYYIEVRVNGTLILANGVNFKKAGSLDPPGMSVYGTINCGINTITFTNGSPAFRLFSGATLITANTLGISVSDLSGSVRLPSRTYSTGANYIFNGSENQSTGTGLTQNVPANLTIDNPYTVTLSAPTTISGSLSILRGTLNMANNNLTVGSLTGSGNIDNGAGGTPGDRTLTIGSDNTSSSYAGVISNVTGTSVSLVKNGTGTLTLSGPNTYTGLTTISGGTIMVGNEGGTTTGSPLGSITSGTRVQSGATLDLNGYSLSEPLYLNGPGIESLGALYNSLANPIMNYSGIITLESSSSIGMVENGDITLMYGIVGDQNLTKVGAGILTLGTGETSLNALTISNGGLIIPTTAQVTLATGQTLTNNGSLDLLSDAYGTASLKVDSYTGNPAKIQLYLSGDPDIYDDINHWHFISTPVAGVNESTFFDNNDETWDLAHFVENISTTSFPGAPQYNWQMSWVGYDGWSYYDEVTTGLPSSSPMVIGKGYNFWDENNDTYTLTGAINTNATSATITLTDRGEGNEGLEGYNLVGNPYTCGIDIQALFDDDYWTSAVKSVWFTIDGASFVFSDGGVAVPDGTDGTILPMTGFFVKATENNGSIPFPLSARAHSTTLRYKGEQASSIPLVRLSINENSKSGETVVRFNEKATAGLDIEFDAPKFMESPGKPSIYTYLDNKEFTINGIPFPETTVEIPVFLNLLAGGNLSISAMQLQELDNFNVTLKDKIANRTVDLKSVKEYSFSASAGEVKDRFILAITKLTTDIENPLAADSQFNIYHGFGQINIQPLADEWDGKTGSVKLMDFSGKSIRYDQNTEFYKNTLIQIPAPERGGLYFVEIRSGMMKFTGKVVVK